MLSRFDLDRLRADDYHLYQIVARKSGQQSGVVDINIGEIIHIAPATRFKLAETAFQHSQPVVKPETTPDIAVVKPKPQVEPPKQEPLPEQIDLEAELKHDVQRAADEAAAKIRLDQYVVEQGLEPSDHNSNAIAAWVRQNLKNYFSAAGIDAAITNLGPRGTNVLRWTPKAAPAPPPSAEPAVEVLEPWQLPIDADERMMKKADKKALLDLNQRRRKLTGQYNIGAGKKLNRVGIAF